MVSLISRGRVLDIISVGLVTNRNRDVLVLDSANGYIRPFETIVFDKTLNAKVASWNMEHIRKIAMPFVV